MVTVSVALCTYNGTRFLAQQLDSILAQSHRPDEIVVCDDASHDGTVEIIEEYSRAYPGLFRSVYNERNLGYIKNFQQAVLLCNGDLIFLSDQDDIWHENKVSTLVDSMQENEGAGYAFSDAVLVDEAGKGIGRELWRSVGFSLRKRDRYLQHHLQGEMLLARNYVTGAALCFRGHLKGLVSPFPGFMVHDHWLALAFSTQGHYGVAVEEPLFQYRLHSGQSLGLKVRSPIKEVIHGWHLKRMKLRKLIEVEAIATWFRSTLGVEGYRERCGFVDEKMAYCNKRLEIGRERVFHKRVTRIVAMLMRGEYGRFESNMTLFKDILS
ncbi:hypothetical protein BOW53_13930 [Solemya pervernicosa gill symbiont]|uniref:Glycosyltransferase 2-like domain-containing protein n=2 Tax=Gammaproteobacteria incertae sedis TaxID=118884 RepID=A0A1T2L198_9GAMM|nr:glycosyltransferase family 2 protein [Candidatus Reidiella endopervernicosa]OOZ38851.1 hypothetical protein BOW53_13930 [Solemya pervernicosa gill symbiont]QKQ26569.1 glycosyltransferase family 2 protein [Candidatus Reidiella endopervernicosa]